MSDSFIVPDDMEIDIDFDIAEMSMEMSYSSVESSTNISSVSTNDLASATTGLSLEDVTENPDTPYDVRASLLIGRFIHVTGFEDNGLCYNARVISYNPATRMHLVVYDHTWLFMTDEYPLLDVTDLWHFAEDPILRLRNSNPNHPRALEGRILIVYPSTNIEEHYVAIVLDYLPTYFTSCNSEFCNLSSGAHNYHAMDVNTEEFIHLNLDDVSYDILV